MRRVLIFQSKLFVDGARDLLLSPISIIAGIIGILISKDNPQEHFDEVIKFGRKSERWINLFECQEHQDDSSTNLEDLMNNVENSILKQAQSRKVSAQALVKLKGVMTKIDQEITKAHDRNKNEPEDSAETKE